MSRIRYTEEQKTQALAMVESQGVTKTSAELNITKGTLYAWRNAEKEKEASEASDLIATAHALISEADDSLSAENERLKKENLRLAAENANLIEKIAKMRDVIHRLLA